MAPPVSPQLLTKQETADLTRMSMRTINYWIRSGKVEVAYLFTGKPLIIAASLWGVKLKLREQRLRRAQRDARSVELEDVAR